MDMRSKNISFGNILNFFYVFFLLFFSTFFSFAKGGNGDFTILEVGTLILIPIDFRENVKMKHLHSQLDIPLRGRGSDPDS